MTKPMETPIILNVPFHEAIVRFVHGESTPAEEPTPEYRKAVPFVKWVDGKRNVVNDLVARFPLTFGKYWEPFVGGGALFFGIHERIVIDP